MAAQAGILRTVIVPFSQSSPENTLMTGDASFFATLMAHALAQGVLTSYVNFYAYPSGIPTTGNGFRMDFVVDATGDAAIVAALPSIAGAVTWASPTTYGF